jgi:benzoate 4-monooxygenase
VGRNLATAQLFIFVASLTARYEFALAARQGEQLETREGFLRKPVEAWLVMQRRKAT